LYDCLAQFCRIVPEWLRGPTLQTARVLGLASLLTLRLHSVGNAQATARITVSATVVNAAPARAAVATARWLAARSGGARKDSGLATIVVNRDRRKVSINYLRN
jgi:hypothetical protein